MLVIKIHPNQEGKEYNPDAFDLDLGDYTSLDGFLDLIRGLGYEVDVEIDPPKLRPGKAVDITHEGVFVDGVKQEGVKPEDVLGFKLLPPSGKPLPRVTLTKIDRERGIVTFNTDTTPEPTEKP